MLSFRSEILLLEDTFPVIRKSNWFGCPAATVVLRISSILSRILFRLIHVFFLFYRNTYFLFSSLFLNFLESNLLHVVRKNAFLNM